MSDPGETLSGATGGAGEGSGSWGRSLGSWVMTRERTPRARGSRASHCDLGRGSALRLRQGASAVESMTHDPNDLGFDRFPHHQLDAYGVALEALCAADVIAKRLPRGNGPLCDQLRRASQSAFLQLAEGAARSGADRA